MKILKGYLQKTEDEIIGIGSTEAQDRDGEIIKQSGWKLENYKKNPVILASHNHHQFPIGKATSLMVDNGKLIFKAIFSKATREAKEAYALVKEGILNTFSVGFIPRKYDKNNSKVITEAELLEISLVSVPANPEAVVVAKGLKDNALAQKLVKYWLLDEEIENKTKKLEIKSVIPYSIHGDSKKAPVESIWDGQEEVKKAEIEQLKKMSTWYNIEKEETKESYKLPHHKVNGEVVFRGVTTAMAALLGARGGVDIPSEDRKGVYDHLAKHYKQFERKAPEFKFFEDIFLASEDLEKSKQTEKKANKVENIELKLLQKTVGHLQLLCKEAKKKGGEKDGR